MAGDTRSKAALGEFEHHVLLAALRLRERAYTATILTELEERTGREVSAAAVYIALRRLERSGLIRSSLKSGPGAQDQRERRYVRLTDRGIKLVRQARQRFERLWEGLALQLKEE